MTAQKPEAGKNYIGLLHEDAKQRRLAEIMAAAKYPILDHILSLVAAMFSRRGEAR
jgi:hypothetical protein